LGVLIQKTTTKDIKGTGGNGIASNYTTGLEDGGRRVQEARL